MHIMFGELLSCHQLDKKWKDKLISAHSKYNRIFIWEKSACKDRYADRRAQHIQTDCIYCSRLTVETWKRAEAVGGERRWTRCELSHLSTSFWRNDRTQREEEEVWGARISSLYIVSHWFIFISENEGLCFFSGDFTGGTLKIRSPKYNKIQEGTAALWVCCSHQMVSLYVDVENFTGQCYQKSGV